MERWYVRLRAWKHRIEGDLKSKWYLWPIAFAFELLWHAIEASTNEYLAEHGMERVKAIVAYIPSSPIALAVWLAVLVFVGLAIHSYFDTREKPVLGTEPTAPKSDAPRLLVDFIDTGQKGKLVFRCDKVAIVRQVHSLISRERYQSEYQFSLSPSVPPPVDPTQPVECQSTD